MEDYKQDIISTRVGCLGGSDAKMLQSIATHGEVVPSAMKRLAVCKGLIEHRQFSNNAMLYGDFVEQNIFNVLHAIDERWQSNPCLVSEKYSRKNCEVIDHVDFMLQDDDKKVLTICECKATAKSFTSTRNEYSAQLAHHWLIGQEIAKKLGGYRLKLLLCHYDTTGLDLDGMFTFDEKRITVKHVRIANVEYDLSKAMDIVDDFLENFNEYYEEEVDGTLLPASVKNQFSAITEALIEIEERKKSVEESKKKLTAFMESKGIKRITSPEWSVTYVAPSESIQFDAKGFLNEYAAKHPKLYKKLVKTHEKRQKRSAYVTIKVNNN